MRIVSKLVRNDMVISKAYAAPVADRSKVGLHLNENLLMSKDYPRKLMDGLNVEDLCLYPSGNDVKVREAIAQRHDVDVSQVFTNNGSSAIVQQIFYASLTNEESILTVDPTWQYYSSLAANIGAKTYLSPLIHNQEAFFFDVDDLIEKANTFSPKIIAICSPNNPTGNRIPLDQLKRLCSQVPEGTMVLLDEAYSDFFESDEGIVGALIRDHENLVVIKTFSKAFGLAGIRVGYGVCNASLAEFLCKDRPAFGISTLSQKIVANALEFGSEHMQRMRQELALSTRYLADTLAVHKEWNLYDSSCNFVLIRHAHFSGHHIANALKQHNYLVKELVVAGNPNYIRLTLPPLDTLKKVVDILLSIDQEKSEADEMVVVRVADHNDWEKIHRINWIIFAEELGQYSIDSGAGFIVDKNHASNIYIVAEYQDSIVGMLAITTPSDVPFSTEKRIRDSSFINLFREKMIEIRLLSVLPEFRGTDVYWKLIFFVLDWAIKRNYCYMLASGIQRAVPLYVQLGFMPVGQPVEEGRATYVPLMASRDSFSKAVKNNTYFKQYLIVDEREAVAAETSVV